MAVSSVAERESFDAFHEPMILNSFTDYHGEMIGLPIITVKAHDAVNAAILNGNATPSDIYRILSHA